MRQQGSRRLLIVVSVEKIVHRIGAKALNLLIASDGLHLSRQLEKQVAEVGHCDLDGVGGGILCGRHGVRDESTS